MPTKARARPAPSNDGTSAKTTKKARTREQRPAGASSTSQDGEGIDKEHSAASGPSNASASLPMGKYLASTDKKTRDGAVQSIAQFLSRSDAEPLSELDMAKLWKGIFYCFWMSDKPRVQQALAQELADIVLLIKSDGEEKASKNTASSKGRTETALQFVEGFFDCMVREWNGIDKWRVPKFYLLVRRFVNAALRLLARERWPVDGIQRLSAIFSKPGGVLCPNDVKVPSGLTYHICDLFLEELDAAARATLFEDKTKPLLPISVLLQPFVTLAARTKSKAVFDRIDFGVITEWAEGLHDAKVVEFLKDGEEDAGSGVEHDEERAPENVAGYLRPIMQQAYVTGDETTQADFVKLHKAIFDELFEAASQTTADDARRRTIYQRFRDEEELRETEAEENAVY